MLTLLATLSTSHGAILPVPYGFPTIHDALLAASPGDIISVDPGTYCESLVVTTPVTIRGSVASNPPVIDGSCTYGQNVVEVDNAVLFLEDLVIDGRFNWRPLAVIDSGYVEGDNIEIINGFSYNDGGGVYVEDDSVFACVRCDIEFNASLGDGGGIYSEGVAALSDSDVCGNYAIEDGGGLFSSGATFLRRTTVVANWADERGGGALVAGFGGHQVHNNVFLENSIAGIQSAAAGLHVSDAADVRNTIFVDHLADIAVDNDNEVNTGGYNLYVDNPGGHVDEPYDADILGGSVNFVDPATSCAGDFSLSFFNVDAAGTGDPELFDGTHPQDRGITGGLSEDIIDSDGDLFDDRIDCDPFDASVYPGAPERCNGEDDDCDGALSPDEQDADGDGWAECEGDCDDDEPTACPDCPIIVGDGVDNDCNGLGECYVDADNDGYGSPVIAATSSCGSGSGFTTTPGDCDDGVDTVYPGAPEVCDGLDNDCDGDIDDDDDDTVDPPAWYHDGDDDGFGDAASSVVACDPPDGHVADSTDCNDVDPDENPGVDEVCDGQDNNCDGLADDADPNVVDPSAWYPDDDSDGYGDPDGTPTLACGRPVGTAASSTDCDDNDVNTFPGAPEQCDTKDNDCDEEVDEDVTFTDWWPDADGDGFGDPAGTPVTDCAAPTGYTGNDLDCNDGESEINPGFPELPCDGIDNDCEPATPDGDCDSGHTGDTGLPADTDTDADADTDTDADADTDADTDTDADADTDADTDTTPAGSTNDKALPPAAPDYGCGCSGGAPLAGWTALWLPLMAGVSRRP